MTELIFSRKFKVWCEWGARAATPQNLAPRFLSTIDQLRRVNPLLDDWECCNEEELMESEGRAGRFPLSQIRQEMVRVIEENMRRDIDTNEPDPDLGYTMSASSKDKPGRAFTYISIDDGDSWPYGTFAANRAQFSIADDDYRNNPLVTFPVFKAATLVLAETWEATYAKVYPDNMVQKTDWDGRKPGWGWMVYVCPHLAKRITPPREVIVEHRPNGGLFMTATEEVFGAENPRHIASARLIRDAMRPVTDLEQPFLVPYF